MRVESSSNVDSRCAFWKSYLSRLAETFRTEYDKLGEDGKARVPYNLFFAKPCQIEVLEFAEPYHQILLIIHDENVDDKEFHIHECGSLNKVTYSTLIQREMLSNRKWDKEITAIGGETCNLRDLLEDVFVSAFKWFEKHAFISSDKPLLFRNGNAISENFGVWFVKGDLLLSDPLGIVLEVCRESQYKYNLPVEEKRKLTPRGKDAEIGFVYVNHVGNYVRIETHEEYDVLEKYRVSSFKDVSTDHKKTTETRVNGFGAYIFPSVWVDEIPKASLQQRTASDLNLLFHQKAVEGTFDNSILVVTKDGFVAVGIDEKYKALRHLNTIMASAIISETQMVSIKEFELGEVTIDVQTKEITGLSMNLGSLRNLQGSLAYTQTSIVPDREIVSSKTLVDIVEAAEKISQNEELQSLSLLLLESYTHLVNMEFSPAFLLSWYIIENWLADRWDNLLNDRSISGKRREKMRNHLLYKTADRIIEVFGLMSEISNEEYSQLMKLKDTRNDIVHRGLVPPEEIVREGFDCAHRIVKNRVQNENCAVDSDERRE